MTIKNAAVFMLISSLFFTGMEPEAKDNSKDTHYTEKGFFDIHVCNWPNRPLFLMGLFSTAHFNDIKSIEIFTPAHQSLGLLNLNKFRTFTTKKKQFKKVFIKQFNMPDKATDGWYSAKITLKNSKIISASDYVEHKSLDIPRLVKPRIIDETAELPGSLQWTKVPGARYYQIFIKDLWNDGKLILTSKLLDKNYYKLPPELLKKGGYYSIRIHARDINEDIKLGDFNHGSLSTKVNFTINE